MIGLLRFSKQHNIIIKNLIFQNSYHKGKINADYADTDVIALAHNGIMHLFNSISYSLSRREIEFVSHPGQATTMLGMLKYPDASLAEGLNQLWVKDSGSSAASLTANTGFALRQDYIINVLNEMDHFNSLFL